MSKFIQFLKSLVFISFSLFCLSCKKENKTFTNKYFSLHDAKQYYIDSIDLGDFTKTLGFQRMTKIVKSDSNMLMFSIGDNIDKEFEKRSGIMIFNYFIPKDSAKSAIELINKQVKSTLEINKQNHSKTFIVLSKSKDTIIGNKKYSFILFKSEEKNTTLGAIGFLTLNNGYYPLNIKFPGTDLEKVDIIDKKKLFTVVENLNIK